MDNKRKNKIVTIIIATAITLTPIICYAAEEETQLQQEESEVLTTLGNTNEENQNVATGIDPTTEPQIKVEQNNTITQEGLSESYSEDVPIASQINEEEKTWFQSIVDFFKNLLGFSSNTNESTTDSNNTDSREGIQFIGKENQNFEILSIEKHKEDESIYPLKIIRIKNKSTGKEYTVMYQHQGGMVVLPD